MVLNRNTDSFVIITAYQSNLGHHRVEDRQHCSIMSLSKLIEVVCSNVVTDTFMFFYPNTRIEKHKKVECSST